MNPDNPLSPDQAKDLQFELARLAERFGLDSLQLCGTTYTPGTKGMTNMVCAGIGNIYARLAVTERWETAIRMEFEEMDCDGYDDMFEFDDDDGDDFLGNTGA